MANPTTSKTARDGYSTVTQIPNKAETPDYTSANQELQLWWEQTLFSSAKQNKSGNWIIPALIVGWFVMFGSIPSYFALNGWVSLAFIVVGLAVMVVSVTFGISFDAVEMDLRDERVAELRRLSKKYLGVKLKQETAHKIYSKLDDGFGVEVGIKKGKPAFVITKRQLPAN